MSRPGEAGTRTPHRPHHPGAASERFTWGFVLLSTWSMAGAYLDAWHHHNLTRPETSFFTPYHFVLYSGIAAIGIFLGLNVLRNYRRYGAWEELLPDGYGVSLLGTAMFSVGGVIDLFWHMRFGIELNLEALVSPPHLLLMLAGGMIVSGPLRAAFRRGGRRATWPAIISGALTLSMFTFFAQFDNPYIDWWAAGTAPDLVRGPMWMEEELGLLGLLIYAAMFSGILVLLLRRFTLPLGTVTMILTVNALLVSPVKNHSDLVAAALLGGAVGDLLLYLIRPVPARPNTFRMFAFAAPAAMVASYLLVVAVTVGIWWPINIWAGSIALSGAVGWLVSFIALPGEKAQARMAEALRPPADVAH